MQRKEDYVEDMGQRDILAVMKDAPIMSSKEESAEDMVQM